MTPSSANLRFLLFVAASGEESTLRITEAASESASLIVSISIKRGWSREIDRIRGDEHSLYIFFGPKESASQLVEMVALHVAACGEFQGGGVPEIPTANRYVTIPVGPPP